MASARKKVTTTQEEADSYWNESNFKRFDFDNDDDSDNINVVTWDGTALTPQSKLKTSAGQVQRVPTASVAGSARQVTSARMHPSASMRRQQQQADQLTPLRGSGGSSVSASIADVARMEDGGRKPSATEVVSLEAKIRTLERQLVQARKSAEKAPSVNETLRQFMVGDAHVLELYKSRESKAEILDKAIERCDGNAILATTLFMRNTLKRDIFSKELRRRPAAMDHYCSYLRAAGEYDELHETLCVTDRGEEAAMLKYGQSINNTSASSASIRLSSLEDSLKFYFEPDIALDFETGWIKEQISITRRQQEMDAEDERHQTNKTNPIFTTHPRAGTIVNKPVVSTLFYACCYHYGEDGIASPEQIKLAHHISQKQFEFVVVKALCWLKKFLALRTFFEQTSFMKRKYIKSEIGLEKIIEVLSQNNAAQEVRMGGALETS